MSKLKIVLVLEEMVPKLEVPEAAVGEEEEMGTMRCGYW
jgi:hypothetical protein